jgi:hypothetical protein
MKKYFRCEKGENVNFFIFVNKFTFLSDEKTLSKMTALYDIM